MGDDRDFDEVETQRTGVAARPQSITAPSKDPLLRLVLLSKNRHRPEDDISIHPSSQAETSLAEDLPMRPATNTFKQAKHPKRTLNDLPPEIQDAIIGHLSGSLHSAASGGSFETNGARNWNMVMRHPRRRQLSDLALVTRVWRDLVQQRLYRHIKVKGTKSDLDRCGDWFLLHDHLQDYVRHVDVWVPVWEMRPETAVGVESNSAPRGVHLQQRTTQFTWHENMGRTHENSIAQAYQLSSQNATLEEILQCAKALFPLAYVLTIEGGHCKRPPRIQHFREYRKPRPHASQSPVPSGETSSRPDPEILSLRLQQTGTARQLPEHKNITTLVLKGAWNIIRTDSDFHLLSFALPNLREWQCNYAKPKAEAYQAMCHIFRYFPPTIVHLNISLEGLHAKGPTSVDKWRSVYPTHHICLDIGRLCPQLESLAYTGRVCFCLFQNALKQGKESRDPCRLKSIDLNVRNCCRDVNEVFNDGTGINNWNFITCFEKLVEHGISALRIYPQLSFLRIRFIDLDSPAPLLNPYFQLHNRNCTGIWSDKILSLLYETRPAAAFEEDLSQDLAMDVRRGGSDDRELKTRPRSIKVASYREYASMVGWA